IQNRSSRECLAMTNNERDSMAPPSPSRRLLYRAYNRAIGRVRSNAALPCRLSGYRPVPGSELLGPYWDWTTLALRNALRDYLRPEHSFLDMGTGSVAVLSLFAHLSTGCRAIVATDHIPEVLASARKNAVAVKAPAEFRQSDLFASVSERFDVIAFNAPYLDVDTARELGIIGDTMSETRFSGGKGGGEIIARFLADAPDHLNPDGKILLGVNHYHIGRGTVREAIERSRLDLETCVRNRLTGSAVYVLHVGRRAHGYAEQTP
ncbi:MAG TPA: methyltransferase, partial [Candidatus Latescibacteria bacterium]|nr:methyltransferase [Candidatus Latescibacterota bacterium]